MTIQKHRYLISFLAIVFVAIYAGCKSQTVSESVPTAPILITPSSIESIVLTKTQTIAPEATHTSIPTSTPKPTDLIPVTAEPTPGNELWGERSYSPNNEWVSKIFKSYENGQTYLTTVVERADASEQWVVEKLPLESNSAIAKFPRPYHWALDGQSFYFTHYGFMDGCFTHINGGYDLYRINLEDGTKDQILAEFASEMSLSPDETSLVHVARGNSGMKLLDIATGLEIELEQIHADLYTDQSGIIWSPDGSEFAFTIMIDVCITDRATTIVLVDVAEHSQRILVKEHDRNLRTIEWLDKKTIRLRDRDDHYWHLNMVDGSLTEQEE